MNYKGFLTFQSIGIAMLLMANHTLATSLQSIEFSALNQDSFEVELVLSDSAQIDSRVYVIDEPARIVLDLPTVTNEVAQRDFTLSFANAKDAILLGTDERTRLVLNLGISTEYEARQSGNRIFLRVGSSTVASTTVPTPVATASVAVTNTAIAATGNGSRITDFNFQRGELGEGNVQFEFSGNRISSDVEQSGNTILLRFFGTDLPAQYERIFDVVDFATPVKEISIDRQDNEIQIEITTLSAFEYLAYQADTSFVLSVKPLTSQQEALRQREFAFSGEKLSLNFQNIEVRAVLQLIADFTGLNLVASDTVTGNITLRLENVPWDQALEIILKAKGLDQRKEGNVLLVAPIAEIAERERLQVQANKQLEELAPLRTEFIRVRYADAATLSSLLTSGTGNSATATATTGTSTVSAATSLSPRGSVIVDTRTNTIILTDTDDKISDFLTLVERIDVPIRQVLIEARIVIANTDFRNELGVRWGNAGVRTLSGGDQALQFGGSRNIFADGGPLGFFNNQSSLSLDDALAVDLGVSAPAASFGLAFLSDSAWVDLELSALENEGHGEIVSQPKIIAGDKQTALIRSGQEIAFQEAAASGATSTSFKEAVLSLEVTPQITPDDRVILNLVISQDSIGDLVFGGIPTIDVTSLETQVLVDNGETLVLGGIFQMTSIDGETRVPLLGSLPIVGQAFRNSITSQEKREILIFITPKILNDNLSPR